MPISHLKKPKSILLKSLPKLKFPKPPVPKLALSIEHPYCKPPTLPLNTLLLEYPKISFVLILNPLPPIMLPSPIELVNEFTLDETADETALVAEVLAL